MASSRYVIGIDLGTTNSAVAYVDTGSPAQDAAVVTLPIPQVVAAGQVAERPLLPSFLYLPGPNELPAGSLRLPWDPNRDEAVGEFARNYGSQVPTRLVASAKSWLSYAGVDRRAALLPWKAPAEARKVSPVEASARYLKHLCEAWNYTVARDVPENRMERQEIVLTVPASFDAVARELTVEAARAVGLEHLTLLEEPQAAFYAWIEASHDRWRQQVELGDVVLVCDVGGGTTDLTLIAVAEEAGQLVLTRVAVGDHILLGGDNMDLALAHHLAQLLAAKGTKLDAGQMHMLWHSCRAAKEQLFSDPKLERAPVTVLGRGSRVVGGTLKCELTRADLEQVLLEGFFPACSLDDVPKRQRAVGLQELGLPYAADPAISKHLAHFLGRHAEVIAERTPSRRGRKKLTQPTAVLFNGGVFKAAPLRDRLVAILNQWAADAGAPPVKVLASQDLDLAVARGAAYYGLVRRGKGVRIRGGTARAYYIGVASALPAVPGTPPPIKAVCVVPFGMEEGTETDVPGQEFGLVVGEPVEFRFLGSTLRRDDAVGTVVEEWEGQIEELSPLATTLEAPGSEGQMVPVHLHSKVTEVGTLELWCLSRQGKQRWKLEFNVREATG
ncbi:MAG: Hsp70 family protein [Gemmataceae bacterium]|nr:Hsp70 family protein [Gemmataceae bacterium]MDW8264160.1 Hsp70 family protein [Gemmataceae bacterium]